MPSPFPCVSQHHKLGTLRCRRGERHPPHLFSSLLDTRWNDRRKETLHMGTARPLAAKPDQNLRDRLQNLAATRDRSSDRLLLQDGLRARAEYPETNLHVTRYEADAWLACPILRCKTYRGMSEGDFPPLRKLSKHRSPAGNIWCRQRDLNPRPRDYKSRALPAELYRPDGFPLPDRICRFKPHLPPVPPSPPRIGRGGAAKTFDGPGAKG